MAAELVPEKALYTHEMAQGGFADFPHVLRGYL
jgi:hypothetical protein